MADTEDRAMWRATYGIAYPTTEEVITDATQPAQVQSRKVRFSVDWKSLEGFGFVTCQFFIQETKDAAGVVQGKEQDAVAYLTFRGCHFDRTFLGRVSFLNCRFVDCSFHECDFGNTKFADCEFTDCRFSECTSWETIFTRTTIDAAAFLKGQCVPLKNFHTAPGRLAEARRKFVKAQAVIASQLVSSLANGNQSDFYDAAIYYAKKYDARVRLSNLTNWTRYRLLAGSNRAAAVALVRDLARAMFIQFNLFLTKGGTSVTRLLVGFAFLTVLAFPVFVLPELRLKYGENVEYCQTAGYPERVATSVEMFLAFGYGNYSPQDSRSHIVATLYTAAGLVWYAFVIPVLLRRIYK